MLKLLFLPAVIIILATGAAAAYFFFVRKDVEGAEQAVVKGEQALMTYAVFAAKAIIGLFAAVLIVVAVAAAIVFGL